MKEPKYKPELDEISIVDIEEKERKGYFTWAMIATYLRMNGGKAIIKVGGQRLLIKNLEERIIDDLED